MVCFSTSWLPPASLIAATCAFEMLLVPERNWSWLMKSNSMLARQPGTSEYPMAASVDREQPQVAQASAGRGTAVASASNVAASSRDASRLALHARCAAVLSTFLRQASRVAWSGEKIIRFIAVLRMASFEAVEPPESMCRGGALYAPLARDKACRRPVRAPERKSDGQTGRGANRGGYGNARAFLRLMQAIARRCVGGTRRQRRKAGLGQEARRQVLDHLAWSTVVIDGVRRTARN